MSSTSIFPIVYRSYVRMNLDHLARMEEKEGGNFERVSVTINSRLSMGKLSRLWIAAKLVKTTILRICIQRDV